MKVGACFFFFTFNLHLSLLLLVFLFPETGGSCQFVLKSALLYLIVWIKKRGHFTLLYAAQFCVLYDIFKSYGSIFSSMP
jgi:hypothetical protein